MVVRGLAGASLAGGSAFTKKRRPDASVVDAICAIVARGPANRPAAIKSKTPARITMWSRVGNNRLGEGMGLYTKSAVVLFLSDSSRGCSQFHSGSATCTQVLLPTRLARPRLLTLSEIITRVRVTRGRSARHFLGLMCLFRQPPPNRAGRHRNHLLAWLRPVSACQHELYRSDPWSHLQLVQPCHLPACPKQLLPNLASVEASPQAGASPLGPHSPPRRRRS